MEITELQEWYQLHYEQELKGRRIIYKDIEPLLKKLSTEIFYKELLGYSENGQPIHKITIGNGKKRILMWSQMHGNESTGTKALFDLFLFLQSKQLKFQENIKLLLEKCTICIIPMLNPDGSIVFTRENAKNIDLNRDAVAKKAIESKLLRSVLDEFNPHFCFNLHDQRSIFNVKGTKNPATISFLAPSEDEERTLTEGRKQTMCVIVAMNKELQKCIPNHIGRYTDEYYPTATGDNFQKLGHNTILIEAGHYKDDYSREKTRAFNFYALVVGMMYIAKNNTFTDYKPYFEIPNNDKKFLDVIYTNVSVNQEFKNVGVQYVFKIEKGILMKYPKIEVMGDLHLYSTHHYINAKNKTLKELKLLN